MNTEETKKKTNRFLLRCREKSDFNQYWYSAFTIETLVNECEKNGKRGAFLSTPSVYFSCNEELKRRSAVFDFDEKFKKKGGKSFVKYDFNFPENVPKEMLHQFDMIVIDPPFITKEVWEKYATTTKLLLTKEKGKGKILLTTIDENEKMIFDLLGCKKRKFRPSIPHLVYQYSVYSNYESDALDVANPEIVM